MPTTDLKIRKVKSFNPQLKKSGFTTCAIINGTETFDSVAEEAARNTTLNKYELAAALGIAAEQFARALKNGYAVDLGPLGKVYPTVTSKWTETPEEQTKSLLKKGLRFDASADLKAAVDAMRLTWEKASEEEVVEEEVVEEDEETETPAPPSQGGSGSNQTPGGSGSTGGGTGSNGSGSGGSGSGTESTEKYTVAWYLPNGNPIIWYELAPGETIPEAPQAPEGYYWHPYPSVMPNHDLDIIPEPIQG